MKNHLSRLLLALVLVPTTSLWAIPTLQLDILGGVYDSSTETTVATTDDFTVRALFKGALTGDTYYLSAAISPGLLESSPTPDFGPVTINGITYLPSDFLYGVPPVDIMDDESGNLQTHSIFPTYYLEMAFTFNALNTVGAYNVQTDAIAPGSLYYHDFTVSVASLSEAYVLHFDLYHEGVKSGIYGVDKFAPFSKDAESGHYVTLVPDEGSVLALLGLGLILVALQRRKLAV
jgi:hypothetical protein